MFWISVIAMLIVASCGCVLAAAAWRGARVDEHPVCRKCRFDLSGNPAANRCGECGRSLRARRAVRIGNRRRLRRVAALGALIAAGGVVAALMVFRYHTRPIDWQAHKPVWLLLMEARGTLSDENREPAIDQLRKRYADAELDDEEVSDFVDVVLDLHETRDPLWNGYLPRLLVDARVSGRMSDAQLSRYLNNGFERSFRQLEPRSIVRQGQPFPFRLPLDGSLGNLSGAIGMRAWIERVTIDGRTLALEEQATTPIEFFTDISMYFDRIALGDAPIGTHTLEVTVRVESDALVPETPATWNPITFVDDTPGFSALITREAVVRVVSEDTQVLEPVDSPDLRAAIAAGLNLSFHGTINRTAGEIIHNGEPLKINVSLRALPVAIDADIFLVLPRQEENLVGAIASSPGELMGERITIPLIEGDVPESFTLVFRGRTDRPRAR